MLKRVNTPFDASAQALADQRVFDAYHQQIKAGLAWHESHDLFEQASKIA